MQKRSFHSFLQALLLVLAVLTFTTCATNPVTGKRQVSLISEQQEIQMGQQYDPQVVAEMGIYDEHVAAAEETCSPGPRISLATFHEFV